MQIHIAKRLWFDVGIKRYTTVACTAKDRERLWFDVGIKRYTTKVVGSIPEPELWFDVGIKRYTTNKQLREMRQGCGLM